MLDKDLQDSELYESRFRFKERSSNVRFFCVLFAVFICFLSFRIWWVNSFSRVLVDGWSMKATLADEQELLMRHVDKKHKPVRGDIIVVYVGGYEECKDVGSQYIIKRLIATAGDKVRCTDGQVQIMYAGTDKYVDLAEPYAYYGTDKAKDSYDFAEYEVHAGEIFFLGDNRSGKGSSVDSRYYDYPNGSRLQDRLYKEKDIYGFITEWSLEHSDFLSKLF